MNSCGRNGIRQIRGVLLKPWNSIISSHLSVMPTTRDRTIQWTNITSSNFSTSTPSTSRADAASQLKTVINALDMAVDGCDWVEQSAEVAYLEREVTDRPPRAQFTENAARNAQRLLQSSIKKTESTLKRLPHAPLEIKRHASEAVVNARMRLVQLEHDMKL